MCNCISAAISRGYVIRGAVYENHDFKNRGYCMPLLMRDDKGRFKLVKLVIHHCPICGEKLEDK